VQHNHGQKERIAQLMNCVYAALFLGSADPAIWTRYYTGVGWARHGAVCFEATFFSVFLAEVPQPFRDRYHNFRRG